MNICETCGFEMWKYNQDSLTCKHGHIAAIGVDERGEPTLTPSGPVAPYVPAAPKRSVPVWAWVLAGVAGDSILHLILGGLG